MIQREKPELTFVIENKLGGVAYFNRNIINHSSLSNSFFIKVILIDQTDSDHPRFNDSIQTDELVDFKFSVYENKYAVLKRLHGLIGRSAGAIVCNDGIEMECIYLLGTEKTVFQIIHDFYNIKLAVKFGEITDAYITHTKLFADVISSADPATVKVFHRPHGVSIPIFQKKERDQIIKLVFVGRLVESKGVKDLYFIDQILKRKNIQVEWTIIGRGPLDIFLKQQWQNENNIRFESPDSNDEVIALIAGHDLFILPTRFEGSPVSVLEALSVGLVPIVSDLPGGIREVIAPEVGFRIPLGENDKFAQAIVTLNSDSNLLNQKSRAARELAENHFDIRKTSNDYFELFSKYKEFKKEKTGRSPISIGFRLDQKWMPNFFVLFIRRLLAHK